MRRAEESILYINEALANSDVDKLIPASHLRGVLEEISYMKMRISVQKELLDLYRSQLEQAEAQAEAKAYL